MSKLTKRQREELDDYVQGYETRGVHGEWWALVQAIKSACSEIDSHRRNKRKKISPGISGL